MARLIVCIGAPGSGKSTWAKEQGLIIVNKDNIRRGLEAQGWVWSKENEKDVIKERDKLISQALAQDLDVISDDTNLAPKHQNTLKALAIKAHAQFEVKDFRDVPIETCIERDAKRVGKARVGRDVIVQMATQYLNYAPPTPRFAPYKWQDGLPEAIICDLDGTISLFGPGTSNLRNPYDASTADKDEPNWPVVEAVKAMLTVGYQLIFLSGREDKFRPQTNSFLSSLSLGAYPLYMRQTGDSRKDWVVKGELFDVHIRDKFNVLFCLDDRQQIVDFYRSLGLTVLQCAKGDF